MTRMKAKNRILAVLAAVFLAVFALFAPVQAIARADDTASVQNLDTTKVDSDLKDIDTTLYGKNENGTVRLVRFQEYCYSEYAMYNDYYGLYVYIYNPTEKPLATEYNQNKVNMAIANIGTSAPDYENVPLKYLGTSESHPKRFYKFKVLFTKNEHAAFLAEVKEYAAAHENVRRYDIASFQLTHTDGSVKDTSELNATNELKTDDRLFSKTLYFSGYGVGMSEETSGEGASSTLTCKYDELETLEIDVKHTNYRELELLSEIGLNTTCDSLDSVYFSIPEEYFTDYGGLQKIEAEWYEYKTKPIFVTSDEGAYNALKTYIGKDTGLWGDSKLPWRVLWEEISEGTFYGSSRYLKGFNGYMGDSIAKDGFLSSYEHYWGDSLGTIIFQNKEYVFKNNSMLNWLFLRSDIKSNADYKVSAEEVLKWAQNYAKTYGTSGYINGKYAQELFEDSIDEDRIQYLEKPANKRGYMKVVVDADAAEDKVNLLEKQKQGFWDEFWNGKKIDTNTYDPIVVIAAHDLSGLDEASFAKKYLIPDVDASIVWQSCNDVIKRGERFVLFRFAVTDYYASTARFDYAEEIGGKSTTMSERDGYVAQETVFMDFDVISLTFRSADGQIDTVIGVCADPIDIFNGLDPTPGLGDDNNELAALIAGIIIIVILIVGLVIVGVYFPGVGNMLLTGAGAAAKGVGTGLKFVGEGIKFVAVSIKDGFVAMFDGGGGKKKK